MTASSLYRKTFTFHPRDWEKLKQVAIEQGFPTRNNFIVSTLKQIISDHEQSKSHDSA